MRKHKKPQTFDLKTSKVNLMTIDHKIIQYLNPFSEFFRTLAGSDRILAWKSKGLSEEIIKPLDTSGKSLLQN